MSARLQSALSGSWAVLGAPVSKPVDDAIRACATLAIFLGTPFRAAVDALGRVNVVGALHGFECRIHGLDV